MEVVLRAAQAVLAGVICVAQPWLLWAGLPREVSHRLTLLVCLVGLGLLACCQTQDKTAGLPWRWRIVVGWLLAVMGWKALPVVRTATYFEHYLGSIYLLNGIVMVFAGVWGIWALRHLPLDWLRQGRWIGSVMVGVNLLAAWPVASSGGDATGLMGIDRLLGAYAVAWGPIVAAWRWWLAPLPLALLLSCGKPSAWMGVAGILAAWRPRIAWWVVPAGVLAVLTISESALITKPNAQLEHDSRLIQRLETWGPVVRATRQHPMAGWGTSPLAWSSVVQSHHPRLPSVHSDWLALALYLGWPTALLVGWAWWEVICVPATSRWMRACQASLAGIGLMALGQSIVSHARLTGVILLLIAWWWAERDHAQEMA